MSNYKSRKHCILAYPESMGDLLEAIKAYDHVGILHDKDTKEDGSLKKAHYHFVIQTKNATWQTALAKDLGIPENLIRQVKNADAMLEYLLHANEENKHQYGIEELIGNTGMVNQVKKLIEKDTMSEGEKVMELLEIIENASEKISYLSFAKFCAKNGRWSEYRRAAGIFNKIIEEKNQGEKIC